MLSGFREGDGSDRKLGTDFQGLDLGQHCPDPTDDLHRIHLRPR